MMFFWQVNQEKTDFRKRASMQTLFQFFCIGFIFSACLITVLQWLNTPMLSHPKKTGIPRLESPLPPFSDEADANEKLNTHVAVEVPTPVEMNRQNESPPPLPYQKY